MTLQTLSWMKWLRAYEENDPEPPLDSWVPNQFYDFQGHETRQVDAHIHWQRRVSRAWVKYTENLGEGAIGI